MPHPIELELRAEVSQEKISPLLLLLNQYGKYLSAVNRLSVMFFDTSKKGNSDIRIRVNNDQCELVLKKGSFHSHDRTEISQTIFPDQFLGMVRIFSELNFQIKVGERKNLNFDFGNDSIVSLIQAGSISYLEIEKFTTSEKLLEDKVFLEEIATNLNVKLMSTKEEFDDLCSRLSEKVDWKFFGKEKDFDKLEKLLRQYIIF